MSMPRSGGSGAGLLLLTAAGLAPGLVLVAALGTRIGLWGVDVGYDLLTQRIAFLLSFAGLAAGATAIALAVRGRIKWLVALAVIVVAATTIGGFLWHKSRISGGGVEDVSTNLAEIPGFGPLAVRRGTAAPTAPVGGERCTGAQPVSTQALPESVVYVLQQEGFAIERAGVTGVFGSRSGFWFGFTNDVAVRIRPGRTDVRVAARDSRPHGGEACRLVSRISERLQAGA